MAIMANSENLKKQSNLREVVRVLWGKPQQTRQQYDVYASPWRSDWRKSAAFSFNNLFYCNYSSITKKHMSEQMSNIKYLLYVILLEVMTLFGGLMRNFQNALYSEDKWTFLI
jgi:hypothetical protein